MPAFLANVTPKGRIVLGASVLGAILFVVFVMKMASAPTYTTMLTALDPAETGKITSALDAKGVKYEIQNNGTALAVEKAQTATARIALAEGGLGTSAKV